MSVTIAYSYIRFSSAAQAEGDSLRRQTEGAEAYCQRHGWKLDTELSLKDLGVSAFRGSNAAVGNFRTFLDAVKGGRVREGSVLVVESFDRLSRQGIDEGYDLIKGILKAGVRIVTLSPEREFGLDAVKSLSRGALEIQLILERAAEESVVKSERIGKARERGRERARRGEVITKKVPAWMTHAGGRIELVPDKVRTVKQLVALALDGLGLTAIATKMNAAGAPVMGAKRLRDRPVVWSSSMVHGVLTSRALLGEYQPYSGQGKNRKPSGAVIPDYYPRAVEPETFAAVQSALRSRHRVGRGRPAKTLNLFAGLLRDARTGGTFSARFVRKRNPVLFANDGVHGRGDQWSSFPLRAFEWAVLSTLAEVRVEDPSPGAPGAPSVQLIRARLQELESLAARWRAKMDRPELIDVVADKLIELEAERRATETRLAEAEAEEGFSLATALGEFRTVAAALGASDTEENRLRCRAAIRRTVDSIWCLFMPGKGRRLAAVQVWLKGDRHRDYVIYHRPAGRSRCGGWAAVTKVRSFADVSGAPAFDLRVRADAAPVEALLAAQDLDSWSGQSAAGSNSSD